MNNTLSSNHFIFSVENPKGPKRYGTNPSIEDVASFLNDQGERAEIVEGHYGVPERSILVHEPKNLPGLHQMAADFGQESGLESHGGEHTLHYYNGPNAGQVVKGKGTVFSKEQPEDNYTTIHTSDGPIHFQHNLDFNKSESLEKAMKPNQKIRQVADQYAQAKGLTLQHGTPNVQVDPVHAQKIATAYESMPHNPDHPAVKNAYNSLIKETGDQFQHIKNSGLKISKIPSNMENPYKAGSQALFDDINNNNHMWYYPTESGYGSNSEVQNHPMQAMTNEKIGGTVVPANDIFRIVHDYFGHAKEGNGFGPNGKERAWQMHKQMYSPEAQKALTSETRGQNSWVNFGPHGESNRANPAQTVYADQKAGLMPDWVVNGENQLQRSEDLAKVKIDHGNMGAPKRIKLGEGANKGRIVDVANERTNSFDIEPKTNDLPIKGINTVGKLTDVSGAQWNKDRKHTVVNEEMPPENGHHIFESKDTHPFMPHSAKQKKLIHGVDINKIQHNRTGWTSVWALSGVTKNAAGVPSIVKGRMPENIVKDEGMGPEYEKLTTAQREGLYHNLGNMMGLGKYIPTTSVVYDKVDRNRQGSAGNHYSVMEKIPGAKHYDGGEKHKAILDKTKAKGDIDKLAIMNMLLGNTDRHGGNWMVNPKQLWMIDHGLTFDWHGQSGRSLITPNYFKEAYRDEQNDSTGEDEDYDHIPAHPEAIKWLKELKPQDFKNFFKTHKVGPEFSRPLINALQSAQRLVKQNKGHLSTMDIMDHIRNSYGVDSD